MNPHKGDLSLDKGGRSRAASYIIIKQGGRHGFSHVIDAMIQRSIDDVNSNTRQSTNKFKHKTVTSSMQ